jgi:two-component system, cell cycle response regulator
MKKVLATEFDELLAVVACVVDGDGTLLDANAGFRRLLPAARPAAIGTRVAHFFIQPSFDSLRTATDARAQGYRGLMTLGDPAGKTRTLRGHAWRTAAGIGVLAEYDVAELERLADAMLDLNRESSVAQTSLARANIALKQREVRIVADSLTDTLTGVGNRRRLEQALAVEIARARRHGAPLSAIMADIDHFKRVNDEHGHAAGDKVLAHFGGLLRSQVRPADIAARFGGEEFVLLLPHTNLAHAASMAERIRGAFADEVIDPLAAPVTSSFGVAQLSAQDDGESLLGRMDAALYRAKEGGRNRVVTAN